MMMALRLAAKVVGLQVVGFNTRKRCSYTIVYAAGMAIYNLIHTDNAWLFVARLRCYFTAK